MRRHGPKEAGHPNNIAQCEGYWQISLGTGRPRHVQEPGNLAINNLISRLPLFSYQTLQITCSSPPVLFDGTRWWREGLFPGGSCVANRSLSEDVGRHTHTYTHRITVENIIRLNAADLAQLNFKGASRLLKTLVMSSLLLGDNLGPSVYHVPALYERHRGDFMSHN